MRVNSTTSRMRRICESVIWFPLYPRCAGLFRPIIGQEGIKRDEVNIGFEKRSLFAQFENQGLLYFFHTAST